MILTLPEYLYEDCTVVRWVDGDTLDMQARAHFETEVAVDPGFKMLATLTQRLTLQYEGRFRLLHADAYEKREPLGPQATAFVNKMMPAGAAVCARTYKDPDSFGRYLADLWLPGKPETTVSAELISAGLATRYEGR